jgi:two-component system sensor histidine kinase MprB
VANVTELAKGQFATTRSEDAEVHTITAACLRAAQRDWPGTPFTAELEPVVVFGNAEQLQIAVRNLLDNAAKFSAPGAPVTVRLSAGELTVQDQGPGIAPADLPHVFDRFYRSRSARAVPGSGLGLSIVRQVAESHGGTVRAESVLGQGTLIRLSLPVTARPSEPVGALTTVVAAEPR